MQKLVDWTRPKATVRPSDYVWGDMDSEAAFSTLGRLMDLMFAKGMISPAEMAAILPSHHVEAVDDEGNDEHK